VYAHESRVVVVLYRAVWGQAGFTAAEASAIRNRAFEHGFEFVTFIPLDQPPQVPDWLPKTRLWLDLARYGESVAAAVIESRVQEAGGYPHDETAVEMMERQFSEQQAASDRAHAVSAKRREGLQPLMDEIYVALAAVAAKSRGHLEVKQRTRTLISAARHGHLLLDFVLQTATYRTERDGDLRVAVWRGSLYDMPGSRPVFDQWFALDVSSSREFGWRSLRDQDAKFLSSAALADWAVKRLLEVPSGA
jgi:hypothetical protein